MVIRAGGERRFRACAGAGGLADVAVRPGVQQAGRAQASPPTTADSEKAYKVACCQPGQIRQAYDLPSPYARGVTGRGTTIVGELTSAVGR